MSGTIINYIGEEEFLLQKLEMQYHNNWVMILLPEAVAETPGSSFMNGDEMKQNP